AFADLRRGIAAPELEGTSRRSQQSGLNGGDPLVDEPGCELAGAERQAPAVGCAATADDRGARTLERAPRARVRASARVDPRRDRELQSVGTSRPSTRLRCEGA